MKLYYKFLLLIFAFTLATSCSKDELDVKNPNEPSLASLETELGIVNFTQGATYRNGFVSLKYSDGVTGLALGTGFHEMWADIVGAEAANVYMNQIGAPYSVFLDNGTEVANPGSPRSQAELIKNNNTNSQAGQNPLYYVWAYSYSLNNIANIILANADGVAFSGNAAVKRDVLKAWAYWWKGYAYSKVGSEYIAGLIIDEPLKTNGNYKTNTEILAEAESNFDKAETILATLSDDADYNTFLGRLIPDFFQAGKGNPPSPQEWIRSINTYRARNIVANKRIEDMTAGDWNQVLTLTANGVRSTDNVFTIRANAAGDVISANTGTIAVKSTGNPNGEATYKISERFIQDFQPGDDRLANNFKQLTTPWIGESARGNSFNTRWQLLDGGNGDAGVVVFSTKVPLAQETYIGPTYEENQLLRAEALIYTNSVNSGLQLIDEVRDYQGAGLAALDGSGLSQANAIVQLKSERRIALLFRYVAFYDVRRYGTIDPIADGGGRTGAIVIDRNGVLNTNATIDYRFMDYFHVPDNELAYNPPADGSAPVVNEKFD